MTMILCSVVHALNKTTPSKEMNELAHWFCKKKLQKANNEIVKNYSRKLRITQACFKKKLNFKLQIGRLKHQGNKCSVKLTKKFL